MLVSGEAVTSVVSQLLAERTEKVCEMAGVMKEAVRVDDEDCSRQQELLSRLATENKVSVNCALVFCVFLLAATGQLSEGWFQFTLTCNELFPTQNCTDYFDSGTARAAGYRPAEQLRAKAEEVGLRFTTQGGAD